MLNSTEFFEKMMEKVRVKVFYTYRDHDAAAG